MHAGGRDDAGNAARGAWRRAGCLSRCALLPCPSLRLCNYSATNKHNVHQHRAASLCVVRLRCAAQRGDARRRAALRRSARFTRARSLLRSPPARRYGRCCRMAPTHLRPRMLSPAASRRASARGWCSCGRACSPALPTRRPLRWQRRAAPPCSGSWTTCSPKSRRRAPTPKNRCCRAETLLADVSANDEHPLKRPLQLPLSRAAQHEAQRTRPRRMRRRAQITLGWHCHKLRPSCQRSRRRGASARWWMPSARSWMR